MDLSATGTPRRLLSAAAIAATVPYLTLKLLWLSGSRVGVGSGPGFASDSALWVLNLVTFGMDAVVVLLALAFVRPWGRRVPAGLLAFPMWIATGLLGTLLIALPIDLALIALLGGEHGSQADWLRPWVFALVYGGFSVQGTALICGFVLYARERWAGLLADRIGDLPRTPTLRLQQALASVAALIALPAVGFQFFWAAGGLTGLPAAMASEAHRPMRVMAAVAGTMVLCGCASVLTVVFRRLPDRPLRPVLVVGWTACGAAFAWSAWMLFAEGIGTRVRDLDHAEPGIHHLVNSAQVISGLLLLVVGAITMIERASARADVESAG